MSFTFDPKRSSEEIAELEKKESKPGLVPAWSFSILGDYEDCPQRVYLTKVKKCPLPDFEAASRGTAIHQLAEDFIKGTIGSVPTELNKFKTLFEVLRDEFSEGNVLVEEDWGFTLDWEPCHWMAKDIWLRMKLDCFAWHSDTSATFYDWKSGKKFGNELKHLTQGQLYAIGSFARFPELQHVNVKFVYTDKGEVLEKDYTREQAYMFKPKWESRALLLTTANDFPAKPSKHTCRWCPHKESGACDWRIE